MSDSLKELMAMGNIPGKGRDRRRQQWLREGEPGQSRANKGTFCRLSLLLSDSAWSGRVCERWG